MATASMEVSRDEDFERRLREIAPLAGKTVQEFCAGGPVHLC